MADHNTSWHQDGLVSILVVHMNPSPEIGVFLAHHYVNLGEYLQSYETWSEVMSSCAVHQVTPT